MTDPTPFERAVVARMAVRFEDWPQEAQAHLVADILAGTVTTREEFRAKCEADNAAFEEHAKNVMEQPR